MSQQIQITGGAKVRDLQDVIIGTSGVLSSVAFNVANGVPKLDSNGKILVSQLPNSVMEYLGTWNAATNTPTLANGTGNQGDVWLCTTPGTVNFGAGPITFIVGDSAIYSGSIWQRSGGATGSVTSVGLSTNGGAITIGNSPITTSGVISANFNGTNLQYVNGAGNLTTFPTLMTSVGLTMPSAFTVTNSPLTGAGGTLAVAGAGTTAQYIRGDGSLATFPTIATEAQRLITEVYNETGATLTKGTVVYINGGHGNLPTITKAIATGDATSAQTYGIVQTDITNNNNGYVVVIGSLGDLDTQAYANGTQLYLSSTTAGAWTSTKQYAPAHLVYVGIVVRSHPTQGVVEVRIQNGFEMDELHNVSAQSPLNNQGLFYNTSTSLWENKSIATALGYTPANDALVVHNTGNETIGGTKTFSDATKNNGGIFLQNASSNSLAGYMNLGGLTNGVKFTSGGGISNTFTLPSATGYTFTFPNATGTIALTSDISYPVTSVFGRTGAVVATEGDYTLTQLGDVTITSPTTGQVLKYNGTAWINDTDANTGTVTSVAMTVPTGLSIAGSPITSSGTLAVTFAAGYSIPTNASQTTWDTAYTNRITSLTTTGTSGAATLTSNTLNIPQYQAALTNPITGTGTSGQVAYFNGTSSLTSSTNLKFDGSNLGIGITPSAWISTVKALQINGGSMYASTNYNFIGNNVVYTSTGDKYINIGYATAYGQTSGEHRWYIAPEGVAAGDAITFTRPMTITTSGNLLVGTEVSTNHKLTVYNATSASQVRVAGAAPSVVFTDTVTDPATYVGYMGMATAANNFMTGSAAGDYIFHNYSGGAMLFGINNSIKVSISSEGIVKIADLAGTGNRMVIASSAGVLSTQAIPSGTVTSVGLSSATSGVTIGATPITTSGTITIAISTATSSQNGLLSSTDWTTFNNKQNALTNPVTGTGTTNYLPKFTGTSTIGNSLVSESGGNISVNGGINMNGTMTIQSSGVTRGYFGDVDGDNNVQLRSQSALTFKTGGNNLRATLDTSGNLGLGVTPSAWDSAQTRVLELGTIGNYFAGYSGSSVLYIGTNSYLASDGWKYARTGFVAGQIDMGGGAFRFLNAVSGTAGAAITWTTAMTLTAAGNLGIGINNASAKLHCYNGSSGGTVSSNSNLLALETNGNNGMQFLNPSSNNANINFGDEFASEIGFIQYQHASDAMRFRAGGTTIMSLVGGNVGIGTSSPNQKLTVYEDTNGQARLSLSNPNTGTSAKSFLYAITTGNRYVGFIQGGANTTGTTSGISNTSLSLIESGGEASALLINAGGTSPLIFATSNAEIMRITSGGNVGVGTDSPYSSARFQVKTATNINIAFQTGTLDSTGIKLNAFNDAGSANIPLEINGSILYFKTAETQRMSITNSGNLLIGNGATDVGSLIHAYTTENRDNMVYTNTNASLSYALFAAKTTRAGGTSCYFYYGEANSVTTYRVYNNGNVQNTNNSYTGISDISIKENIFDTTPKLADLLKVRVVNYNLKAPYENHKQIGVIAQELEKIFPNMIDIDGNTKLKSVKYSVFVPMLIKAVQELKQEIETLKNK